MGFVQCCVWLFMVRIPPEAFQNGVKENCYTCRRIWGCDSWTMVSFIPASAIYFMDYWAYIERGQKKKYTEGTNSKLFPRLSHTWARLLVLEWFYFNCVCTPAKILLNPLQRVVRVGCEVSIFYKADKEVMWANRDTWAAAEWSE